MAQIGLVFRWAAIGLLVGALVPALLWAPLLLVSSKNDAADEIWDALEPALQDRDTTWLLVRSGALMGGTLGLIITPALAPRVASLWYLASRRLGGLLGRADPRDLGALTVGLLAGLIGYSLRL